MRRAARTDTNQSEIVHAYRQLGASVQHLHTIGQGCPDLAVGIQGITLLVEIKSAKGELTPDEQRWHNLWRGQVEIVRSIDEAVERIEYWQRVAEVLWEITRKI